MGSAGVAAGWFVLSGLGRDGQWIACFVHDDDHNYGDDGWRGRRIDGDGDGNPNVDDKRELNDDDGCYHDRRFDDQFGGCRHNGGNRNRGGLGHGIADGIYRCIDDIDPCVHGWFVHVGFVDGIQPDRRS